MAKDLIAIRDKGNRSAIVFIHGFSGKGDSTWGEFPEFLTSDDTLDGWDIFSIDYETHLLFSRAIFWESLPPIERIANSFHTDCMSGRLAGYDNLCIVAHSMGGLVAQQAMLIDDALPEKISHLIMFGTPSNGLKKAGPFWWWSRQVEDMADDSDFIISLRKNWRDNQQKLNFNKLVVAGTKDEFVPEESCHAPFEDSICKFIEGNHLQIVRPTAPTDKNVQLVINTLKGNRPISSFVDSASLAIEKRDFQKAVKLYEENVDKLDEGSLVQYALALCAETKPDVAIEALIRYGQMKKRTDAMGTLAGRYKRLWQQSGIEDFYRYADELYTDAYNLSEGDPDQLYYHAINLAYLNVAKGKGSTKAMENALPWADAALRHTDDAITSYWQQATIAEALLIKGEFGPACEQYVTAFKFGPQPREVESTFMQAMDIFRHCYPKMESAEQLAIHFNTKI